MRTARAFSCPKPNAFLCNLSVRNKHDALISMQMSNENFRLDVLENDILALSEKLMSLLLFDHTAQENIYWACDDYAHLGKGYTFNDPINIDCVTGNNGNVIMPRVAKSKVQQEARSKEMAEVFSTKWDFVIIDKAHEGTQTELGQNVIKAVTKKQTYTLNLSGTPFNILDDYEEEICHSFLLQAEYLLGKGDDVLA